MRQQKRVLVALRLAFRGYPASLQCDSLSTTVKSRVTEAMTNHEHLSHLNHVVRDVRTVGRRRTMDECRYGGWKCILLKE